LQNSARFDRSGAGARIAQVGQLVFQFAQRIDP